ncbi:hypothetical protein D3C76_1506960 [compost metagenome]
MKRQRAKSGKIEPAIFISNRDFLAGWCLRRIDRSLCVAATKNLAAKRVVARGVGPFAGVELRKTLRFGR